MTTRLPCSSSRFLCLLATTLALLVCTFVARTARADDDAGAPDAAPAEPSVTPPAPTPTPTPAPAPTPAQPSTAPSPSSSAVDPRATSAAEPSTPPGAPNYAPLAPDTTPLTPFPAADGSGTSSGLQLTPTGFVEAYYAWNFNRPANNITNYRGFDNRHNSFTLSNVAIGTFFETGPVSGKIMLQVGSTPSTYYAQEPTQNGASGANASGPELWKYLQEAYVTYKAPIGRGLSVSAGLMTTPLGLERIAVKDNWAWSRSNLYFAMPQYFTGVRAAYPLTDRLTVTAAVLNGWSSVVDNNDAKSVQTYVTYRVPDKAVLQLLYMGGVERAGTAPEGQYWRHHFDAVGQVSVTSWLELAAQADYGFEPNRVGNARWFAGAASARARALKWLYVSVRGDRFYEHRAADGTLLSTPIFWNGVEWVSSATATIDVRPHSNISFRFEFRHDQADGLLYFTGDRLEGDGSAKQPYVTNARRQQTLLLGATAWF